MVNVRTVDEYDFGFSWVIDEAMTRTSHALVADGRVWLIDPVDVPEQIDRAAALGEPAAVVRLLDRHGRDADAIAERLGVPLHDLPQQLPDSPFEAVRLTHNRLWKEVALWWPERRALVVAEAVGTNRDVHRRRRAAGRPHRPAAVSRRAGWPSSRPITCSSATAPGCTARRPPPALREAIDRSRRDLPTVLVKLPGALR